MTIAKVATNGFSGGLSYPASITATFAGGAVATAGRKLLAGFTASSGTPTVTTPAGWTKVNVESNTVGLRGFLYWKDAVGDETGVTFSWTPSGSFGSAFVIEIPEALKAGAPTVTAENEAQAGTAGSTSCSSGTATAAFAAGLALAFFTADYSANVNGGRAYSNGFVEDFFYDNSLSRSSCATASKAIAAIGDYSTTFSCTDTGDEIYGAILLFESAHVDTPTVLSAIGGAIGVTAGAGAIVPGSAVALSAAGARVALEAGSTAISIGTSVLLSASGASIGLAAGAAGISIGSAVALSAAGAVVTLFAGSAAILVGAGVPTNPALFALAARNVGHALRQLVITPLSRGRRIIARRTRRIEGGSR